MNPRITTGIAKNKRLNVPNIPDFRAVQEVAKLAVFSIIGDKILNSRCLDLYAGSGNMGLEALSRGASWCDFVDIDKKSNEVVRENIQKCGFEDKSEVFGKDCVKFVANTENEYDFIFVDPFYKDTNHIFLMFNIQQILKENGIIIFFHGDNLDINKILIKTNLKIIDERRFGKSYFTIISK